MIEIISMARLYTKQCQEDKVAGQSGLFFYLSVLKIEFKTMNKTRSYDHIYKISIIEIDH